MLDDHGPQSCSKPVASEFMFNALKEKYVQGVSNAKVNSVENSKMGEDSRERNAAVVS